MLPFGKQKNYKQKYGKNTNMKVLETELLYLCKLDC